MMARPGVTLEEVEQAVAVLEEQGENITHLAVRDRLGSGSLTTISNHLKALRARGEAPASMTIELPSEIDAAYRGLLAELWQKAQAAASKDVEMLRHTANRRVEATENELNLVMSRFDEMADNVTQTTQDLDAANQRLRELEQKLAKSEGENDALMKQISTLTGTLQGQAANFERWMEQVKIANPTRRQGEAIGQKGKETEPG